MVYVGRVSSPCHVCTRCDRNPSFALLGCGDRVLKTVIHFLTLPKMTLVPIVKCCDKFFLQQVFNNNFVFIAPASECGRLGFKL